MLREAKEAHATFEMSVIPEARSQTLAVHWFIREDLYTVKHMKTCEMIHLA